MREPVVTLYDKGLIAQPMYRGIRPLKIGDLPPPYPLFKPSSQFTRKIVYRTRVVDAKPSTERAALSGSPGKAGRQGGEGAKAPLPPPRAAPPPSKRELYEIERKKEREMRAYERRMRIRAEMGEEAWAAEQRRRQENMLRKKIQYQTTKKCKDAIEWGQDAAKFPTTQTFNQHMVIERIKRAVQVVRDMHLKKQQNLHGRPLVHFEKDGGLYNRLRVPEDEEEIASLAAMRKKIEEEEMTAALEAHAKKQSKAKERPSDSGPARQTETATATGTTTAGASSQTSVSGSSSLSESTSSGTSVSSES